jgi:hypothetical protein
MDDMTKQVLQTAAASVIRHGLTTAAGALVTDGLIESGDAAGFVKIGSGIVMGVGALGWSWWQKSGQVAVSDALKHLTSKKTAAAAVATAQALPAGAAVTKALALFAVLLASLVFIPQAMAQSPVKKPPLTGNIVTDFNAARGNAVTTAATTAETSEQAAANKIFAALAKPFQDLAAFIGADIEGAVTLSTAIPALQDGHGQQCWMEMRQFSAIVKAHPVPVTLKLATDLEALRLSMMAANNLCANVHCTEVFDDLANAVVTLAPINAGIAIPSLKSLCSKVPQVPVIAPVTDTAAPASSGPAAPSPAAPVTPPAAK